MDPPGVTCPDRMLRCNPPLCSTFWKLNGFIFRNKLRSVKGRIQYRAFPLLHCETHLGPINESFPFIVSRVRNDICVFQNCLANSDLGTIIRIPKGKCFPKYFRCPSKFLYHFQSFSSKACVILQQHFIKHINILNQDVEKDESSNPFVTLCLFKLSM